MSEKGPSPSSPDKEPVKSPLHVEGVPAALQIEIIEQLREKEAILENEMAAQAMRDDPLQLDVQEKARERARAQFDQLIEQHLAANGISSDDEKYQEYVALLRNYSVDHIPDNIWKDGKSDGKGNQVVPPLRDAAYAEVKEKYAPQTAPEPGKEGEPTTTGTEGEPKEGNGTEPVEGTKTDEPKPKEGDERTKTSTETTDKGLEVEREHVDKLRAELAKLSARRQGRFWKKKSLEKEYTEKEEQYNNALIKLTRDELSAEKAAGKERTEDEERAEAALRIITSHHNLQAASVEELENTKIGTFIKLMTSGGRVARIAKGVALGVVVGAIGAGVTAATVGTAGGAVGAGIATALTLANRYARGLAAFDKDRGVDVINLKGENLGTNYLQEAGAKEKSTPEAIEALHKHLMAQFEEATKAEVSKRRKATTKAMGAVIVGAALAEGVHALVDAVSSYNVEDANNWLAGGNSSHTNALAGTGDHLPQNPAPSIIEHPKVPEKVYSPNALSIKSGEGWYQTFKDMNIPKEEWSGLLEKVGPQLHDVQVGGHPLAYEMPNGQWGIRMTPGGKMPQEALDIISRAHEHVSGGNNVPTASIESPSPRISLPIAESNTGSVPSVPTNVESVTTPVDHGGIQNIVHKQVIQPSDIAGNTQLEKLTNVATWMPPETIGQRLGVSALDWQHLEDYIATQVTNPSAQYHGLYDRVFEVTPAGYLRFITSDIPDNTMANMLSQIPVEARSKL
jgi:hypothetical protein